MYSLSCYYQKLNEYAPIYLSDKMVEQGAYDNSGILVKTSDNITGVLFTLDLTESAVKRAKALGLNTIVTHHPVIYKPIASLSVDGNNAAVTLAIKNGMNIISMHLNLDICENGIDVSLCEGLGGKEYKIINYVTENHGYGREFKCAKTLGDFIKNAKSVFGSKKIIAYGNKNAKISLAASFCGAGATEALDYIRGGGKAEVIVTSDLSHHEIKEILDNGKNLVILPHYVAEEYGFNKFYAWAKKEVGELSTQYLADKRFK